MCPHYMYSLRHLKRRRRRSETVSLKGKVVDFRMKDLLMGDT